MNSVKKLFAIGVGALLCLSARAQCVDPALGFQDNIGGDHRFIVLSWADSGCVSFLEGTRQVDPDPFTDPNAVWFTLQPTFHFRQIIPTNGGFRIGPITKRVLIDMEDFRDPFAETNTIYAPQCWFVRFKNYPR